MITGIKRVSCLLYGSKGWIILKDKKLVGFIWKLRDGDFKLAYKSISDYGPVRFSNSFDDAVGKMIESGYY